MWADPLLDSLAGTLNESSVPLGSRADEGPGEVPSGFSRRTAGPARVDPLVHHNALRIRSSAVRLRWTQ